MPNAFVTLPCKVNYVARDTHRVLPETPSCTGMPSRPFSAAPLVRHFRRACTAGLRLCQGSVPSAPACLRCWSLQLNRVTYLVQAWALFVCAHRFVCHPHAGALLIFPSSFTRRCVIPKGSPVSAPHICAAVRKSGNITCIQETTKS